MPYPWECLDCRWLDTSDKKWGEYYCQRNHYYVRADSPSCSHIDNKNGSSSGCYLTTAMCNILGFEDDCTILNTLRNFRDDYMTNDDECKPLLEDYDTFGPEIAYRLDQYIEKELVADVMLQMYINPAVECINNDKYDDAVEIYKEMTLGLAQWFGIDNEQFNCNRQIDSVKTRKREIVF